MIEINSNFVIALNLVDIIFNADLFSQLVLNGSDSYRVLMRQNIALQLISLKTFSDFICFISETRNNITVNHRYYS